MNEIKQQMHKALRELGYQVRMVNHPNILYKDARTASDKPVILRFRFAKTSWRHEYKVKDGDWIKLKSAYYKNTSITEEGKVTATKFN